MNLTAYNQTDSTPIAANPDPTPSHTVPISSHITPISPDPTPEPPHATLMPSDTTPEHSHPATIPSVVQSFQDKLSFQDGQFAGGLAYLILNKYYNSSFSKVLPLKVLSGDELQVVFFDYQEKKDAEKLDRVLLVLNAKKEVLSAYHGDKGGGS